MNDGPPPLILASTSPRRAQLLREAGYAFETVAPPYDDSADPTPAGTPGEIVEMLARRKARSVAAAHPDALVLGSDTLLVRDGRILGKPADRQQALTMLQSLAGRSHEACSGVCLIHRDRTQVFHDVATVRLGDLDPTVLRDYVDSDAWVGKAGGYNLAELKSRWPFEISGDPSTVIGLPMERLAEALRRYHIRPTVP